MSNRARLETKLAYLEALHAGAATDGERAAAGSALGRIRARLAEVRADDPPEEYRFTFHSFWSQKLFVALLRRYGLTPYRYMRQRHTTVMVKVTRSFVDDMLWPEYLELDKELTSQLDEVAEQLITETIFRDSSEVKEVAGIPHQVSEQG